MGSTTTLSGFAARLRGFIGVSMMHREGTAGRDARFTRRQDACATSEEDFSGLAVELFGLQYEHNAPYRRFCETRGVRPEMLEGWTQIPAIPTVAFKELELSCLPPEGRTAVFHSSGTTGRERSRHFHNADSLAIYEASLLPWFAASVFGKQARTNPQRMIFLTPGSRLAPHSSLVHMFETVRREFGSPESVFVGSMAEDGGWRLDLKATLEALRTVARDERPIIVLGTAFSFVHLLDHLVDQKLNVELPPGSVALETGGYKSRSRSLPKAELHSLITQRLGISPFYIVCEYGMSELCSQAYDRRVSDAPSFRTSARQVGAASRVTGDAAGSRRMRFPTWCRVQIISPETGREVGEGETGLIRVFDLANVYSVMAIQTEDLGIRRRDGFELIGRAALAEPRGCSLMAAENLS